MRIILSAVIGATVAAVITVVVLRSLDVENSAAIAGGVGGAVGALAVPRRRKERG